MDRSSRGCALHASRDIPPSFITMLEAICKPKTSRTSGKSKVALPVKAYKHVFAATKERTFLFENAVETYPPASHTIECMLFERASNTLDGKRREGPRTRRGLGLKKHALAAFLGGLSCGLSWGLSRGLCRQLGTPKSPQSLQTRKGPGAQPRGLGKTILLSRSARPARSP